MCFFIIIFFQICLKIVFETSGLKKNYHSSPAIAIVSKTVQGLHAAVQLDIQFKSTQGKSGWPKRVLFFINRFKFPAVLFLERLAIIVNPG